MGVSLVLVVFLLGMASGASLFYFGQRSAGRRPPTGPPPRDEGIERLDRELQLDPAQRERLLQIVDEHRVKLHEFMEATLSRMREVLRPEQQKRFDELHPSNPEPPPPLRRERPPREGPQPPPRDRREPPPPDGAPRPPGL